MTLQFMRSQSLEPEVQNRQIGILMLKVLMQPTFNHDHNPNVENFDFKL
jgi:hypothetical protein